MKDPEERSRRMPALSSRLKAVIDLVLPCSVLADVGTDHGLLPVAAVCRGLARRAIAADLREAPLRSARRHIERSPVADRVISLQGDGLLALEGLAVDAIVMAGLSGDLMRRLCEAAPHVLGHAEQLVVQPNQNPECMRAWALASGWHLRDETMVETRGRFFVVCAFVRQAGRDPCYRVEGWTEDALCKIGPKLLARKDLVMARFCELQRERVSRLVDRGVRRMEAELSLWEAACRG